MNVEKNSVRTPTSLNTGEPTQVSSRTPVALARETSAGAQAFWDTRSFTGKGKLVQCPRAEEIHRMETLTRVCVCVCVCVFIVYVCVYVCVCVFIHKHPQNHDAWIIFHRSEIWWCRCREESRWAVQGVSCTACCVSSQEFLIQRGVLRAFWIREKAAWGLYLWKKSKFSFKKQMQPASIFCSHLNIYGRNICSWPSGTESTNMYVSVHTVVFRLACLAVSVVSWGRSELYYKVSQGQNWIFLPFFCHGHCSQKNISVPCIF